MKRVLGVVSLLALLAALLALVSAAGARPQATSPVKGSFKYCSDPTFPPMESKTAAGKPIGFDVDLACRRRSPVCCRRSGRRSARW